MRIFAGVLIIVVAVLDLFGSLGYLGVGAFTRGVGQVGDKAADAAAKDDPSVDREKAKAAADKIETAGIKFQLQGLFLLAMGGMGIAAGVMLFRAKAASFVLLVGVLQIVADGISCALLQHVGVTNIVAMAVGALVILTALTYPRPAEIANQPA